MMTCTPVLSMLTMASLYTKEQFQRQQNNNKTMLEIIRSAVKAEIQDKQERRLFFARLDQLSYSLDALLTTCSKTELPLETLLTYAQPEVFRELNTPLPKQDCGCDGKSKKVDKRYKPGAKRKVHKKRLDPVLLEIKLKNINQKELLDTMGNQARRRSFRLEALEKQVIYNEKKLARMVREIEEDETDGES
ncbi:hypothetical protein CJU90_4422 [Yarrowia sp. C11]|nr:hypothetical protein CKK34_6704 [Yarrowia sp. E02]KAG5365346.1 hypothetical protein CJU90_4422 [Yarrowia sp. C11]